MRSASIFGCTTAVRALAGIIVFLACASNGFALGQKQYVETSRRTGDFVIAQRQSLATIYVDPNDHAGVVRAVNDLQADIARVTGRTAALSNAASTLSTNSIIIGTIGKSAIIDQLIAGKKIDVSAIAGKWESFLIQVVDQPTAGVASALVIVGSDKRGTIYGVYDLSEQIGVSHGMGQRKVWRLQA